MAAVIIENEHGQILIARSKKGKAQEGLWEFPGGKIEKNETIKECLERELLEEMNIRIQPCESFVVK
ncbi:NUDIX domain-containing protein [Paenibacillus sp. D51F]